MDNLKLFMVRKTKGDLAIVPAAGAKRMILKDHHQGFFEREIQGAELTGSLKNYRTDRKCNVIESTLHDFAVESVDFTHCDFKENAIRSCQFKDSQFGSSSWAYNAVVNSSFENCCFPDTDIQNCEFDEVKFVRCDFRNVLVKGCTFNRCSFQECQTNNKVFETCRITNCTFRTTELQAQTVAENFGLKLSDLNTPLRDDRTDGRWNELTPSDLEIWIQKKATHPLQKVNVEYFLNGNILEGSPNLDACLDINSWLPAFRTAVSFATVLSRWVEFLLWLYERDELAVHTLICAHSMTDRLLKALGDRPRPQALTTIGGTHLRLARPVEQYLLLLEKCVAKWQDGASFLVEGHQTKPYYYRTMAPLFRRGPARITKLVRHNSPWDLGVTFASGTSATLFFALFLATRTRIELFRINQKTEIPPASETASSTANSKVSRKKNPREEPAGKSIVSLDFGGSHALKATPNFRLKAFLPGNLVAEFRLDVSSKQIGKLRKTLRDLLQ